MLLRHIVLLSLLLAILRLLLRLHHRTRVSLLRLGMTVRVARRLLRMVLRRIGIHRGENTDALSRFDEGGIGLVLSARR